MNGFVDEDSSAVVNEATVAIRLAVELGDEDLIAQSYLWSAVAYYYADDQRSAEEALDNANKWSSKLEKQEDKLILGFWNEYKGNEYAVEKRMEGYYKGTELARRAARHLKAGILRRSSGSFSSNKSRLRRTKSRRSRRSLEKESIARSGDGRQSVLLDID